LTTRSIIAFYPSLEIAELAELALISRGIPQRDIALSARASSFGETAAMQAARSPEASRQERHYFQWLVGARVPETRIRRYRTLLDEGAALLCVRVADESAEEARAILRRHDPLDLGTDQASLIDTAYAGGKPGVAGAGDLDDYLVGPHPADEENGAT
jgi:hypothetical protein